MSSLYNRARVATATTGTGTMTLGAATSAAFFTFAEAGVPDGTVVSYVIEDGTNVELGVGTYTASGTTLSRDTVTASKIGGTAGTTKLTLSGSAIVYIDALAADIVPWSAVTGTLSYTATLNAAMNLELINSSTGVSAQAGVHFKSGTTAEMQVFASSVNNRNFWYSNTGGLRFTVVTGGDPLEFYTNNTFRGIMTWDGLFGWGTNSPLRLFHPSQDVAATNTVTYNERLTVTSTGTPANGIGVGTEYEVEVQAGVNKVGATVEAYAYDVTAASEDFSLVFKTMSAGAAATEEMRAGFAPMSLVQNDSIVMRGNYGMVVPEAYEIAAGITLELGAGAIMEITA